MATKKQVLKFFEAVKALLLSLGAVETGKQMYRYRLDTRAGDLFIDFHESDAEKPKRNDFLYSVFCRFEDPTKAFEVLGTKDMDRLNKHSGKWNFHYTDADYLLSCLEQNLKQVMLYKDRMNLYLIDHPNHYCDNYQKAITLARKNGYKLADDCSYNGYIFFEKYICGGEYRLRLQVYDDIIKKAAPHYEQYERGLCHEDLMSFSKLADPNHKTQMTYHMSKGQSDWSANNVDELFALAIRKEKTLTDEHLKFISKDKERRTIWGDLGANPTEEEIQELANRMKGGKAYLFYNEVSESYEIDCKRFKTDKHKFIRRVIPA